MYNHKQDHERLEMLLEDYIDHDDKKAKDLYMYYVDYCDVYGLQNSLKGLYNAYERRMEKDGTH